MENKQTIVETVRYHVNRDFRSRKGKMTDFIGGLLEIADKEEFSSEQFWFGDDGSFEPEGINEDFDKFVGEFRQHFVAELSDIVAMSELEDSAELLAEWESQNSTKTVSMAGKMLPGDFPLSVEEFEGYAEYSYSENSYDFEEFYWSKIDQKKVDEIRYKMNCYLDSI